MEVTFTRVIRTPHSERHVLRRGGADLRLWIFTT